MDSSSYDKIARVLFGIVLGMMTFLMTNLALASFAGLVHLDFRYSWLFFLPAAALSLLTGGGLGAVLTWQIYRTEGT